MVGKKWQIYHTWDGMGNAFVRLAVGVGELMK